MTARVISARSARSARSNHSKIKKDNISDSEMTSLDSFDISQESHDEKKRVIE